MVQAILAITFNDAFKDPVRLTRGQFTSAKTLWPCVIVRPVASYRTLPCQGIPYAVQNASDEAENTTFGHRPPCLGAIPAET